MKLRPTWNRNATKYTKELPVAAENATKVQDIRVSVIFKFCLSLSMFLTRSTFSSKVSINRTTRTRPIKMMFLF